MMGKVQYPGMFFQRDAESGKYEDIKFGSSDFSGPSLDYRKIKDLEYDPVCLRFLQNPIFRQLGEKNIGPNVASMRAMMMNKPAGGSSSLPYHQDISTEWEMTIPPVLTIWTAIDEATRENGCLEIIPRSHLHGMIGNGHILRPEDEPRYAPPGSSLFLEMTAGEAVVFNNALLHRSGANRSNRSRLALTLCLMDAATRHRKTQRAYPVIFGEGALTPESVGALERIPPQVYVPASATV
jgi:ectoine hydroxylase-related dioxygenase (phytanoyl-CoA dioxygenase family)